MLVTAATRPSPRDTILPCQSTNGAGCLLEHVWYLAPRQSNRFASGAWEIGAQRCAGASLQKTRLDGEAASLCGARVWRGTTQGLRSCLH